MIFTPPDLASSGITGLTTDPGALNEVSSTLLSSPGGGRRYRIWQWGFSILTGVACALQIRIGDFLPVDYGSLAVTNSTPLAIQEFPGGLLTPSAASIRIRHRATIASLPFRVWILYTVEDL